MLIGVPLETAAGETRVSVTPETAKKLKAQGHTIKVQSGAGVAASVTDAAYEAAGAEITDAAGAFGCDLVLKVRAPLHSELSLMKTGAALVGMLNPFDSDGLHRMAGAGITSFAHECRAGLHQRQLAVQRRTHLQHQIAAQRRGGIDDLGASRFVRRVGHARADARAGLNLDGVALGLQLLDRLGRGGHARFTGRCF